MDNLSYICYLHLLNLFIRRHIASLQWKKLTNIQSNHYKFSVKKTKYLDVLNNIHCVYISL